MSDSLLMTDLLSESNLCSVVNKSNQTLPFPLTFPKTTRSQQSHVNSHSNTDNCLRGFAWNKKKQKTCAKRRTRKASTCVKPSCFGIVSQCHLKLMRNKKNVDWEREKCASTCDCCCRQDWLLNLKRVDLDRSAFPHETLQSLQEAFGDLLLEMEDDNDEDDVDADLEDGSDNDDEEEVTNDDIAELAEKLKGLGVQPKTP